MSTTSLLKLSFVFSLALGLASCSSNESIDEVNPKLNPSINKGIVIDVIEKSEVASSQLPEGTIVRKTSQGSLAFDLPKGVVLAWQDESGVWNQTSSYGYSCTASEGCGTGCDVIYAQGVYGCTQCSNPKSCTGKPTVDQVESIGYPNDGSAILTDNNGGYLFLNDPVRFGTINQLTSLKTPKNFFSHPVVSEALKKFLTENGLTPVEKGTPDVQYLPVVAFGVQLGLAVRNSQLESLAKRAPSARNNTLMAGITCSCTSGSGCTKDSGWGYEKCERSTSCTTCCMNCPPEHE